MSIRRPVASIAVLALVAACSGSAGPTPAPSAAPKAAATASALSTGSAIAVAAGYSHSCALTKTGGITCWGYNDVGMLGNGTTTESNTPVDVPGPAGGYTAIAAGFGATCAVTKAGDARCWGLDGYGQLGNGTTTSDRPNPTPVDVTGLTGRVTELAMGSEAGSLHTCALTSAGGVMCWGYNASGQLGDGSTTDSSRPVAVSGLASGAMSITAGASSACATTKANGVECWGSNDHGQLGTGAAADSSTPVAVSGLRPGVIAVAAGGSHTCALTAAGGVKCWGANDSGQLGNGSTVNSRTPVDVTGLTGGVIAIAAGGAHTCALTAAGSVKCWGANVFAGGETATSKPGGGQLGNGSMLSSNNPVDVVGLTSGVVAIAAGGAQTCALTERLGLMCWGSAGHGEMTSPATTDSLIPVPVPGL